MAAHGHNGATSVSERSGFTVLCQQNHSAFVRCHGQKHPETAIYRSLLATREEREEKQGSGV